MKASRIEGIRRGEAISITVNGKETQAYSGESIAAALMASGHRKIHVADKSGSPRGYFCGMGMCFDCMATVNGISHVRTCITQVQPGCEVITD